jgi:hypothetical protein
MPDNYISVDPNAGTPAGSSRYLSTDPNAGGETDARQASNTSGAGAGDGTASLIGPAVLAAGKAAPAIVSGINTAAKVAPSLASGVRNLGYGAAAVQLAQGKPKEAAITAGSTYAVPKIANAIANATAPARSTVVRDAAGRFASMPAPGGMLSRMAGLASRYAGPAAMVASALNAETQPSEGPLADHARQQQQIREAEFFQQHPEYRRATDIDLPGDQPQSTRALAHSEVLKIMRGTK